MISLADKTEVRRWLYVTWYLGVRLVGLWVAFVLFFLFSWSIGQTVEWIVP